MKRKRRKKNNPVKFWADKLLFHDNNEIKLFQNLKVSIKVSELYFDEFEKFLNYYRDRVVVCGGKKSFGFGFCKIKIKEDSTNIKSSYSIAKSSSTKFMSKEISIIDAPYNKIVLGFNFKYYKRSHECKKYREINFGKLFESSNFFFSAKLKGQNQIYIIGFNNYDDNNHNDENGHNDEKQKFDELFKKYSKF